MTLPSQDGSRLYSAEDGRQGDRGTRGQGEVNFLFPCPPFSLSPCPLFPPYPYNALNGPSARKRLSAEAISGATETTRNWGQWWAGGATVSVTRTSRVSGRVSFSRAPASRMPCVAATVI